MNFCKVSTVFHCYKHWQWILTVDWYHVWNLTNTSVYNLCTSQIAKFSRTDICYQHHRVIKTSRYAGQKYKEDAVYGQRMPMTKDSFKHCSDFFLLVCSSPAYQSRMPAVLHGHLATLSFPSYLLYTHIRPHTCTLTFSTNYFKNIHSWRWSRREQKNSEDFCDRQPQLAAFLIFLNIVWFQGAINNTSQNAPQRDKKTKVFASSGCHKAKIWVWKWIRT